MKIPLWLRIVLVVFMLILMGGWFFFKNRPVVPKSAAQLSSMQVQAEAQHIVDLMNHDGIDKNLAYITQRSAEDEAFARSCHPILHELGHVAYHAFGSYDAAIKYQNGLCNSGYTHGVIEEYFESASHVKEAMNVACPNSAQHDFAQWQCFHGVGHGVMLVSKKDVGASLVLCKILPSSFAIGSCANGVFMEHFNIVSHDGTVINAQHVGLKDCLAQEQQYKAECNFYAPSAFLAAHFADYIGAFTWCQAAEQTYHGNCVSGVGSQLMKENITKPTYVASVCERAPLNFREDCAAGALGYFNTFHASSDAAAGLCANVFRSFTTACRNLSQSNPAL